MTDKTLTKLQRFYSFAYTRPWAWAVLRFVVVPVYAAVTIVRQHIPEFIDELREDWAEIEAERAEDLKAIQRTA